VGAVPPPPPPPPPALGEGGATLAAAPPPPPPTAMDLPDVAAPPPPPAAMDLPDVVAPPPPPAAQTTGPLEAEMSPEASVPPPPAPTVSDTDAHVTAAESAGTTPAPEVVSTTVVGEPEVKTIDTGNTVEAAVVAEPKKLDDASGETSTAVADATVTTDSDGKRISAINTSSGVDEPTIDGSSGERKLHEMEATIVELQDKARAVEAEQQEKKKLEKEASMRSQISEEPSLRDSKDMPPVVDEGEEEIVLVNTEFVWAEGAFRDVKLCGAWNGWMPQQMYSEGDTGFWSVVTPLPLGIHDFKFIVDGEWRTSTLHPVIADMSGKVNVRAVKGIPDPANYPKDALITAAPETARERRKKSGCCTIS